MRALLIALQFLTRLPTPSVPAAPKDIGRSLLFYPLVGVLIGALLYALAWSMAGTPSMVLAALVLTLWVLLSGGLHLDGLADSADAWLGGYGDRERTLAIMKDPYCGPAGVIALVLVLLVKFTALHSLLDSGRFTWLLLAPLLGRSLLPLLFLTTPYVRAGGLGSALAEHLPRQAAWLVLAIVVTALAWYLPLIPVAGSLAAALLAFLILRLLMMERLGGTTGDTAGALVEIGETAVLLALVLA